MFILEVISVIAGIPAMTVGELFIFVGIVATSAMVPAATGLAVYKRFH